tara:strand:+ start:24476 stop:25213 length:738 start_codon:yes stop_codon:yes gene_type:complete
MNGDKKKSNDISYLVDKRFEGIEPGYDERPESYRQNYFDMAKSFQGFFGEPVEASDEESLNLLEQWLDNYFPQTVTEKFENVDYYNPKSGEQDLISVMKGKEFMNFMQDQFEGVTPDSINTRREMSKDYFNNLKKESALQERLFSIESKDFDELDESALNQFNSLAIVQNILSNQMTMPGELGVDPMLPEGMPSELDFTPKSRTLNFGDMLREQEDMMRKSDELQKKFGQQSGYIIVGEDGSFTF